MDAAHERSIDVPHKEEFDNEYMRKLYDVGYDQGVKGIPWDKTPPGFTAPVAVGK